METVEERLTQLEERVREMEEVMKLQNATPPVEKKGWRAFVGVDENNPLFADAVRFGREWRFADSPKDEDAP